MLDAIKDSNFLLTAPIIIPASEIGNSFTISEMNVGIGVTIYANNKEITRFVPENSSKTLTFRLDPGKKHYIVAKDDAGNTSSVLVACTYYATMLAGLAQDWFAHVRRDLEDHERQLNSRFSSRLLEHRVSFENLLPRTRSFRRQLVRMGAKSLVNEMTTEQGVIDLTTAGTSQTPIVMPVASPKTTFSPHVYPIFNTASSFGGFEFHIWLFNSCVASWSAFIRLANNLDDDIMKLIEVGESSVKVEVDGILEEHVFDFTSIDCGLESILAEFLDCMASIRSYIRTTISSEYVFELYGYELDVEVSSPLGGRWLDSDTGLDSGVTLDTEDDIDPMAAGGDGWVGTGLSGRNDFAAVDTVVKRVDTFATYSPIYEGPASTPLQTQGLSSDLDHAIAATSSGSITVVGSATVTAYIQIINNSFDSGDTITVGGVPFVYGAAFDWVAGPIAEDTAVNIANAMNAAPPVAGFVAIASGLSPIVAMYVPYVGPPPVVTLSVIDGATTNFVISGPQFT